MGAGGRSLRPSWVGFGVRSVQGVTPSQYIQLQEHHLRLFLVSYFLGILYYMPNTPLLAGK